MLSNPLSGKCRTIRNEVFAVEGKRILITGCTGLIGKGLSKTLARKNTVFGVARFTQPGVMEELSACGVHCIPLDLEQPDLERIPRDIDTFFHMAVFWKCRDEFEKACQVNVWVIGQIIERCPHLEFVAVGSSAAVYNMELRRYSITEEMEAFPDSHYGHTKLLGETIAEYFSKTRTIARSILRYWYPYTDDPSSKIDYY